MRIVLSGSELPEPSTFWSAPAAAVKVSAPDSITPARAGPEGIVFGGGLSINPPRARQHHPRARGTGDALTEAFSSSAAHHPRARGTGPGIARRFGNLTAQNFP